MSELNEESTSESVTSTMDYGLSDAELQWLTMIDFLCYGDGDETE